MMNALRAAQPILRTLARPATAATLLAAGLKFDEVQQYPNAFERPLNKHTSSITGGLVGAAVGAVLRQRAPLLFATAAATATAFQGIENLRAKDYYYNSNKAPEGFVPDLEDAITGRFGPPPASTSQTAAAGTEAKSAA